MTRQRRIARLEVEAQRREWARYCPKGWTLDAFMNAAIAWLEQPLEARLASMPMFTEAEHIEIASRLPAYRRARLR